MENRTSIGIRLQEDEPDFLAWFAAHHPEEAKKLFNRYLRYIAMQRSIHRGTST